MATTRRVSTHTPDLVELTILGAWFGLATSAVELAIVGWHTVLLGQLEYGAGAHLLWMVPVANVATFLVPALVLAVVARLWPGAVSRRGALSLLAGLVALAVLLRLKQHLHWLAIVALAAGCGIQAGTVLARYAPGFRRLLRWTLPLGCAAVLVAAVTIPLSRTILERRGLNGLAAAPAGAPNIVLIILDTVREMSVDFDGSSEQSTPNLARWAPQGVVFERAIATAPWTLPSHASMFTGRWAVDLPRFSQHGLGLGDELPTLAGVLQANGYATAGFLGNRVINRASGLARGFLHFEVFSNRPSQVMVTPTLLRSLLSAKAVRWMLGQYDVPGRKSAADVNRAFLDWTAAHRDHRPFFAFLNYYDAHAPYLPPPPFDTRFDPRGGEHRPVLLEQLNVAGADSATTGAERDAYLGTVAYLDAQLGALLDRMLRDGMLRNTVVIISSDHGEELGEHGKFGHGHTLHTELLSVPFLVIAPGRVPAGRRVERPVSLVDLPATILDLAGVPASGIGGRSMRGAWQAGWRDGPVWSEGVYGDDSRSVIAGRFHYIRDPGATGRLFDMIRDPGERKDLAGDSAFASTRDRLRRLIALEPDARARFIDSSGGHDP